MKYVLLIVTMIMISGCGKEDLYNLVGHRKFKVGDCVATGHDNDHEEFDKDKADYKITAIGKHRYQMEFIYNNRLSGQFNDMIFGYLWEGFYHKVDCPKGLK